METIRTLLVEDEVDTHRSVETKICAKRGEPFAVEHRRTLRSAVSRVRAGDIDVVLLDLDLPDASGIDSVTHLHAAAPEVPIVVVTETDDAQLALQVLQARAEDYLVKAQVDHAVIERTVRHALERHRIHVGIERHVYALAKQHARFRDVVSSSSDGLAVLSREGVVLFANRSAAKLVGRQIHELQGEMLGYPFAPQACRELPLYDGRVIEVHGIESEWDGQPAWLASIFDITGHKLAQADLEQANAGMQRRNAGLARLASIDPLTELLNRRGLAAVLAAELGRRRRNSAPLTAVLLDCDDFKGVNELLGHAGGDDVLKALADRLRRSLRPSDHVGRIGGDEFLVLLPDTRFAEAFQVAERLRLAVSDQSLVLPSGPVHVTASLGIELLDEGIHSIDEVIVRTEAALQHSKRQGKNRVSTQDGGGAGGLRDSEELVAGLLVKSAYRVLRQPILQLSDESTVGWRLSCRGPVGAFELPRDFFRLALERKILTQVDLLCLERCLGEARDLPASSSCHVAVFPSTLLETPRDRLSELFARRHTDVQLCVEISEEQFVGDPSRLLEFVAALREADVRLALTDVGFGRSSLEALILLEPDIVKVDREFIVKTTKDASKGRSLRRMVGVAASLGCELVAEGVESREELALLREIGVPYGQGSLWGQPEQLKFSTTTR